MRTHVLHGGTGAGSRLVICAWQPCPVVAVLCAGFAHILEGLCVVAFCMKVCSRGQPTVDGVCEGFTQGCFVH